MAFQSAPDLARKFFTDFQSRAVPAAKSVVQNVGNFFTTPHPINIHSTTPNALGQKVFNAVGNFNPVDAAPFISPITKQQLKPFVPTLGQYAQGNIIKPIQQGAKTLQSNQPVLNRALGAAQMVGGGFSATPLGAAFNTIYGGISGGLRSVRTGQPLAQSVRQGISTPSDIGGTGLGIQNPYLAMGVDVLTGNPKAALKNIKNLKSGLKTFDVNVARQNISTLNKKTNLNDFVKRSTGNQNNFAYIEDLPSNISSQFGTAIKTVISEDRIAHLQKRPKLFQSIINNLPEIIKNPDQVIPNPNRVNSFILLKQNGKNIGAAIEIDRVGDYNFVRTVQPMPARTIKSYLKKVESGEPAILSSLPENQMRQSSGNIVSDVQKSTNTIIPQGVNNRMGTGIPTSSPEENLPKTTGIIQPETPQISKSNIAETGPLGMASGNGKGSSGKSITQVPNSENPYFNTNRINVKPEGKHLINQTIQEVKPQIEQIVGKKLSNNEVIATANNSARVLRKVVDRQQTSDFEAALLKTRQKLAAMSESGTVDKDYLDTLITLKSHATDIGRKLQSFNINADPKNITAKNAIMEAVTKVEKDSNKILEAAKGVDFNDFNQATNFYRKFIKPTTGEWVDTLRYNSMLSSPNTHINNAFSNLVNTAFVAPIEKTLTGTVDFLKSAVTGKPRQAYASEGAAYLKGYGSNLNEASHRFAEVMRGNRVSTNLDVRSIPLAQKGIKGGIEKGLTTFTRLLEASDQFFTTLTSSGEKAALQLRKSKGVNVGNIETKAAENAAYRLFRSELGDSKQGHLLDGIDKFTALVQQARTSDSPIFSTLAKFTLPFVRTPMNILKQGIEYSPAGILTLPGAANKTEQISKIILGSSAAAATAMLAASGRTTWAVPTDPQAKDAFYAAGMQPYSVKIGDKWVSYSKLPPAISFNIALIAAIHDAEQNKQLDDGQVQTILDGVAKWGNFFADQSYLKNIGDFVAAAKGDPVAFSQAVSNYPQQIIPFRAMSGWIARTLDPYMRKVDPGEDFLHKQIDLIKTQIPGLSQQVTPRFDDRGKPVPNTNRFINAVSPERITTENAEGKARYDNRQVELKANKWVKPLNDEIKTQVDKVSPDITNNVYNQVIQGGDFTEEQKRQIYDKVKEKVRTRVKSVVMKRKAKDIFKLLQTAPGTTREEKKIYLMKLKSSGLLNQDVVDAFSQN